MSDTQFPLGHKIGLNPGHLLCWVSHNLWEFEQVLSKHLYCLSSGHSSILLQNDVFSTQDPSKHKYGLYSGHFIPIEV